MENKISYVKKMCQYSICSLTSIKLAFFINWKWAQRSTASCLTTQYLPAPSHYASFPTQAASHPSPPHNLLPLSASSALEWDGASERAGPGPHLGQGNIKKSHWCQLWLLEGVYIHAKPVNHRFCFLPRRISQVWSIFYVVAFQLFEDWVSPCLLTPYSLQPLSAPVLLAEHPQSFTTLHMWSEIQSSPRPSCCLLNMLQMFIVVYIWDVMSRMENL